MNLKIKILLEKTKLKLKQILIAMYALIGMASVLMFAGYTVNEYGKFYYGGKLIVVNNVRAEDQSFESSDRTVPVDNQGFKKGIFTAYTSEVGQTDSTPYITADGTDLRTRFDCIVANNKLPFGSKVEIEGIGTCEVHDRGASRHPENWFDIYMGDDKSKALRFGKKELNYKEL